MRAAAMIAVAALCGPCDQIAKGLEKKTAEELVVTEGGEAGEGEVDVEIRLNMPQLQGGFAVVLKKEGEELYLPVFIGDAEGTAIQRGLDRQRMSRPMTHELLGSAIAKLGGRVDRLVISDIRDGVYYGTLYVEEEGVMKTLDCRPSDGMALAAHVMAPIKVDEKVFDAVGMTRDELGREGFPVEAL